MRCEMRLEVVLTVTPILAPRMRAVNPIRKMDFEEVAFHFLQALALLATCGTRHRWFGSGSNSGGGGDDGGRSL